MGFPSAHTRRSLRDASDHELREMRSIADQRGLVALKRAVAEELSGR